MTCHRRVPRPIFLFAVLPHPRIAVCASVLHRLWWIGGEVYFSFLCNLYQLQITLPLFHSSMPYEGGKSWDTLSEYSSDFYHTICLEASDEDFCEDDNKTWIWRMRLILGGENGLLDKNLSAKMVQRFSFWFSRGRKWLGDFDEGTLQSFSSDVVKEYIC